MRGGWGVAAFWTSSALAALAAALVAATVFLSSRNQELQADVNQRQQFIDQSVQLSRLNANLIRALANAAVANRDDKLREILAEVGVTFTVNPDAPAAAEKKAP
ncbi:MAG: hypothetical protein ACLQJR_22930 [Stellaceae bacterium]